MLAQSRMFLAALGLGLCTGAAAAGELEETIVGPAHVINNATIDVAVRVRLAGIDRPDHAKFCTRPVDGGTHALPWLRDAASFPCEQEVVGKLRALIEGRVVTCLSQDRDDRGRLVATCSAPGIPDIGAALARESRGAR